MEISPCPVGREREYHRLFTPDALEFLQDLVTTFEYRVSEILRARKLKKLSLERYGELPDFKLKGQSLKGNWKVAPVPKRLQNRHLDLGDVAPSNSDHLIKALNANVQGIQVDYDDGCCPSWTNMLSGLCNIVTIVHGEFYPKEVPPLESSPLLILRPRAWNMNEHNILVRGREIPGTLMDFGLLIFHTGTKLASCGAGPFFYLSKVEGANEAALWNDIFVWSQHKLGLPIGTIKACVLIENILASFEMEEILYELRDHSLGLNCGIWDYAASFVNKFGTRRDFLLPDRNKYVNMEKHFLASYMRLVVQVCHNRGAMATGGMAAITLNGLNESEKMQKIETVCKAKLREIHNGVDGFMVYDVDLVPWINELWTRFGALTPNQIHAILHENLRIRAADLLQIPKGGVTLQGLTNNIKVGISFIFSWLWYGRGHFILDGAVEDSATAEISRSQVWQWIRHRANLEDGTRETVTKGLVNAIALKLCEQMKSLLTNNRETTALDSSYRIFLEIVTASEFPEFITTYLYNHSSFRYLQST